MRCTLALAISLLLAGSSFAIMNKQEPPHDMCVFDQRWTGFTVGATAGTWINASDGAARPSGNFLLPANIANNPQRTNTFGFHGAGFIGGLQIGGNYQMKTVVLGAETDFNYSTMTRHHNVSKNLTSPLAGTFNVNVSEHFHWFGTLRPRLGFAMKPVLLYGTGGLAYGQMRSRTNVSFSLAGDHYSGSKSKWAFGWTLGAGLEWAFNSHWSTKLEYLFLSLKKMRYDDPNTPPPSFSSFAYKSSVKTKGNIVRIGFNYTI